MGLNVKGSKANWSYPGFDSFQQNIASWSEKNKSYKKSLEPLLSGSRYGFTIPRAKALAMLPALKSLAESNDIPGILWSIHDQPNLVKLIERIEDLDKGESLVFH